MKTVKLSGWLARGARNLSLGLAVVAGAGVAGPGCAAPPEVRGTWMTTTANTAIATPTNTAASMKALRDIGLNVVYVETWKNGYTEFPSEIMREAVGVPMKINAAPAHLQRDLLQETLIEAHRNQLIYIGWFEYGFMAAYKDTDNELREVYKDRLTMTADGSLVSSQNPFVWLNPLHPDSRALLLGIVLEAVDRYDLDGVQLDDRIAWPTSMGYDPYTVALYKQEHGGQAPPKDDKDPDWVKWRADKVSEFAEQFYTELKAKRPNLIVSISPAIWDWCMRYYACDWKAWSHAGWMDEYIPQIYRNTFERVRQDWPAQIQAAGPGRKGDLVAGLRMVGEGPATSWPDYEKKMRLVRQSGAGGHCHWFSRGVLEVYPQELTRFYNVEKNGHSPYPLLPKDWRPAPIELRLAQDAWQAKDVPAGRYRLIAKVDGRWQRVARLQHDGGPFEHAAADNAEAVELLVDRAFDRPLEQGDR